MSVLLGKTSASALSRQDYGCWEIEHEKKENRIFSAGPASSVRTMGPNIVSICNLMNELRTEPETEPETERGAQEPGTELETEPETEMGTKPGKELGTGPEIELETEPEIELGTEPGIEGGTEQGTDPGIAESS